MKAILSNKKGLENLEVNNLTIPLIKPNEVLIKVKAIGVNPVDWKGLESREFGNSYILGTDISGIIEKVGSEISKFKVGDEVIGSLNWKKQGAYAEFVTSEEQFLAHKSKKITFQEAAAIPLASLTAWQGLFDKLQLKKNEKIVIQAAAGGVGLFALQLAKWAGAYVIAIASKKNELFLKSLGADVVIDYRTTDFSTVLKNIDAVFDSVEIEEKSFRILKKRGRYVGLSSLSTPISENLLAQYDVVASKFLFKSNATQLEKIMSLIDEEKLRIVLDKVFPLKEAKKALEYQKKGHSKGKNILVTE